MALYHHQDTLRALPGGAGESGVTVTFKLAADNSTLTTATTDSNGFYQKSLAATATTGQSSYILHPGPYYTEATVGSYTRRSASSSIGTAGPLHLPAQLFLNRAMGTGLVSSPGSGLNTWAVTADGSARSVVVATGAAVVEGIPLWNDAARTVTISANASGNPRIDTIVIEVVPQGNATEGKVTLKVVEGTAAASPVAPTLTQTTTLYQFPLANVSVANGAATIAQANITDRRDYVERAVTTIESDVAALEAIVTPGVRLVAYYQGAYDPAAMLANYGFTSTTVVPTFKSGYTAIAATDVIIASHASVDTSAAVYGKAVRATDTSITYAVYNNWSATLDITSATLTLLVLRLALS